MTEQDLLATAKAQIEAFNDADWDLWRTLVAPNCVNVEVGTQRKLVGHDENIESMKGWKSAFPDVKGTVKNAYVSGDTVVLELTWSGTHNGPLHGPGGIIPASGRHQSTDAVFISDHQDGVIVHSRHYFDMMTLLKQIGAMPGEETESAGA